MGFYDISENVDTYIKMCDGYDGSRLYRELFKYLNDGASVLELGSGPGLDITFLKEHYRLTGSDLSDEFLRRLKARFPDIPFLKMNAINIEINETFDCIYSNKVLHHLTKDELDLSFRSQSKSLNPNGLVAHSFWIGEESKEMEGMLFSYYRKEEIVDILSERFLILSALSYSEFEDSDSLFLIAQLK